MSKALRIVLLIVATWVLAIATVWVVRWAGALDSESLAQASIDMAFASRGGPPPNANQTAGAAAMMGMMFRFYPIIIPITMTIWMLVMTTIFFIAMRFIDGPPSWATVFEATAIAAACHAAATLVLTGIAALGNRPSAADVISGRFVVTNLTAFLPTETPVLLIVLARRLDVLTIIFLIVLGVTLADRVSPKSRNAVAGVIVGCFALWVSASLVMALIMPSMMR